jgi:hypothetical protein
MKAYFQDLEDNYFELENKNNKIITELENLNKDKTEEKEYIDGIYNIYENHNVDDLGLYGLRQLEKKTLKSLNVIRDKKQERKLIVI